MPWCEECSRYLTPNSVHQDGTCPSCGDTLQLSDGDTDPSAVSDEKAPWHFKLMVFSITVYLAWRFIQVVTGSL